MIKFLLYILIFLGSCCWGLFPGGLKLLSPFMFICILMGYMCDKNTTNRKQLLWFYVFLALSVVSCKIFRNQSYWLSFMFFLRICPQRSKNIKNLFKKYSHVSLPEKLGIYPIFVYSQFPFHK